MSVEQLSSDFSAAVTELLWRQWSQIGVSGFPPSEAAHMAVDPEALLLCTLDVGGADPRLFGEVLDWWAANHDLISTHRLRSLSTGERDAALIAGGSLWVAGHGPRAAGAKARAPVIDAARPQLSLHPMLTPLSDGLTDPWFQRAGVTVAKMGRSGKSLPPDFAAPINFAFRLRRLFGLGARAEIMRALLTIRAPRFTAGAVRASAGFSKPSVNEALSELVDSGLVRRVDVGSQYWYSTNVQSWSELLGITDPIYLPGHRDWIPLLYAVRSLARWLQQTSTQDLSPYLLASGARTQFEHVSPHLQFAELGVAVRPFSPGAEYWDSFEGMVLELIKGIDAL
jgi:hypothetical protein